MRRSSGEYRPTSFLSSQPLPRESPWRSMSLALLRRDRSSCSLDERNRGENPLKSSPLNRLRGSSLGDSFVSHLETGRSGPSFLCACENSTTSGGNLIKLIAIIRLYDHDDDDDDDDNDDDDDEQQRSENIICRHDDDAHKSCVDALIKKDTKVFCMHEDRSGRHFLFLFFCFSFFFCLSRAEISSVSVVFFSWWKLPGSEYSTCSSLLSHSYFFSFFNSTRLTFIYNENTLDWDNSLNKFIIIGNILSLCVMLVVYNCSDEFCRLLFFFLFFCSFFFFFFFFR